MVQDKILGQEGSRLVNWKLEIVFNFFLIKIFFSAWIKCMVKKWEKRIWRNVKHAGVNYEFNNRINTLFYFIKCFHRVDHLVILYLECMEINHFELTENKRQHYWESRRKACPNRSTFSIGLVRTVIIIDPETSFIIPFNLILRMNKICRHSFSAILKIQDVLVFKRKRYSREKRGY